MNKLLSCPPQDEISASIRSKADKITVKTFTVLGRSTHNAPLGALSTSTYQSALLHKVYGGAGALIHREYQDAGAFIY